MKVFSQPPHILNREDKVGRSRAEQSSMASSSLSWVPAAATLRHSSTAFRLCPPTSVPIRRRFTCLAMKDLLGDFGARDPFPAEVASNFGENVIGSSDTEHKILIPNISSLSLSQTPFQNPPLALPIDDAHRLMKKVVGWRLVEPEGSTACLECVWKVRDHDCGVELISRINKVAEETGQSPDLRLEQPNMVRVQLRTRSIGCLSINDFILASKLDEINVMDLIPRKRVWA